MTDSKRKVIKSADLDQALSLESKLDLRESAHVSGGEKKIIRENDQQVIQQAEAILRQAQDDADKIKKRAKQIYLEVEARVKEARDKGYEDGKEAGLQALTEMALQMQKKNQEIVQTLSTQALQLIYEIGRKVIGECFATSDDAVLSMVKQALQASMGNQLVLLVNPEDYQRLHGHESELMSALHGSQTLTLKPAETVKKSGCVIESEMGTLEANLENQLQVIKKALGV